MIVDENGMVADRWSAQHQGTAKYVLRMGDKSSRQNDAQTGSLTTPRKEREASIKNSPATGRPQPLAAGLSDAFLGLLWDLHNCAVAVAVVILDTTTLMKSHIIVWAVRLGGSSCGGKGGKGERSATRTRPMLGWRGATRKSNHSLSLSFSLCSWLSLAL